jgi:SAM-dependent methyltransferase
MSGNPDSWVYGDIAPDPGARDLIGLKSRWIVEQLPREATSVLDYGSGEGKYLQLISNVRPQARRVGVDVRDVHRTVDYEFHKVGQNAPLPFDADTFDAVISCDVLEHVDSIERSLDEIRRVLRPGGSFIGFVPMEGGPGAHAFFRLLDKNIYRDTKDHNHAYTHRELHSWFASRFRIVQLAYSYHFLGGTLDALFFASFKAPGIGRRMEEFWRGQENPFYRGGSAGGRPSLVSRLAKFANRLAYHESRFLQNVSWGAGGLHFHVQKP